MLFDNQDLFVEIQPGQGTIGDIIVYYNSEYNSVIHSGYIVSGSGILSNDASRNPVCYIVVSKWAEAGLYQHNAMDCPYTSFDGFGSSETADYFRYFRAINEHEHSFLYTNTVCNNHESNCTCGYHRADCTICDYCYFEEHELKHKNNLTTAECDCKYSETHTVEYINNGSNNHTLICTDCGLTSTEAHTLKKTNSGNGNHHSVICTDCGYTSTETHTFRYTNETTNYQHRATCTKCGYSRLETHTWKTTNNLIFRCLDCGVITQGPIVLESIPDDLLEKMNLEFGNGDGAVAYDENTVLCRIDGEYYLLEGITIEDAVTHITNGNNVTE